MGDVDKRIVDRVAAAINERHDRAYDQIVMMLFLTQAMLADHHEPGCWQAWLLIGLALATAVFGAVRRWLGRKYHV